MATLAPRPLPSAFPPPSSGPQPSFSSALACDTQGLCVTGSCLLPFPLDPQPGPAFSSPGLLLTKIHLPQCFSSGLIHVPRSPAAVWVSGFVPSPASLPWVCVALCLWPRILPRLSLRWLLRLHPVTGSEDREAVDQSRQEFISGPAHRCVLAPGWSGRAGGADEAGLWSWSVRGQAHPRPPHPAAVSRAPAVLLGASGVWAQAGLSPALGYRAGSARSQMVEGPVPQGLGAICVCVLDRPPGLALGAFVTRGGSPVPPSLS